MTIFIEETNFHNAWTRAIRQVLMRGRDCIIGDATEPKPIKDLTSLIVLEGEAIKQIERRELHPQFPFRMIDQYREEYTYEFDHSKFVYTYFDRLTNREVNQLNSLREGLRIQIETGIFSNRNQGVTWNIEIDDDNVSPPCLQRIWIRYEGNNEAKVHLTWRSRDLYTAWQANLVALVDMINREIIIPNNCKIIRIIDYCDSIHIYKSDIEQAKRVRLISVNPQENYD